MRLYLQSVAHHSGGTAPDSHRLPLLLPSPVILEKENLKVYYMYLEGMVLVEYSGVRIREPIKMMIANSNLFYCKTNYIDLSSVTGELETFMRKMPAGIGDKPPGGGVPSD